MPAAYHLPPSPRYDWDLDDAKGDFPDGDISELNDEELELLMQNRMNHEQPRRPYRERRYGEYRRPGSPWSDHND